MTSVVDGTTGQRRLSITHCGSPCQARELAVLKRSWSSNIYSKSMLRIARLWKARTASRVSELRACKGKSSSPGQSSNPSKRAVSHVAQDGRPFRMAVVGSGPAGFYTAYKVMSNIKNARIDMYEYLPVPFGLVRFGVAPDHPEVKVGRSNTGDAAFYQMLQLVLIFFRVHFLVIWCLMHHLLRIVKTDLRKLRRPRDSTSSATLK